MDISENIKKVREAKRISQSELARKLSIEPTNYPRIEKRGNGLTIKQIQEIADALGVSVGELLGGEAKVETSSEVVEKLERLEKENKLLNELLDSKRNEIESMKNDFQDYFNVNIFMSVIYKLNTMTVNIFNKDTKEKVKSLTIQDFLKYSLNAEREFCEYDFESINENRLKIYKEILSESTFNIITKLMLKHKLLDEKIHEGLYDIDKSTDVDFLTSSKLNLYNYSNRKRIVYP